MQEGTEGTKSRGGFGDFLQKRKLKLSFDLKASKLNLEKTQKEAKTRLKQLLWMSEKTRKVSFVQQCSRYG